MVFKTALGKTLAIVNHNNVIKLRNGIAVRRILDNGTVKDKQGRTLGLINSGNKNPGSCLFFDLIPNN